MGGFCHDCPRGGSTAPRAACCIEAAMAKVLDHPINAIATERRRRLQIQAQDETTADLPFRPMPLRNRKERRRAASIARRSP